MPHARGARRRRAVTRQRDARDSRANAPEVPLTPAQDGHLRALGYSH
jgi:hypothetical protein